MSEVSYRQAVVRHLQSMNESASSRAQLELARTISITILCVVLLVIFPVFSRLMRLRYRVIDFLQYLTDEQVKNQHQECLAYNRRLKAFKEGISFEEEQEEEEKKEEERKESPEKVTVEDAPAQAAFDMKPKKKKNKSKKVKKQLTKNQTKYQGKEAEEAEVEVNLSEKDEEDSDSDSSSSQKKKNKKQKK